MTATVLSVRSILSSHLAVWTSVPLKSCRPGMSGHFQLLYRGAQVSIYMIHGSGVFIMVSRTVLTSTHHHH